MHAGFASHAWSWELLGRFTCVFGMEHLQNERRWPDDSTGHGWVCARTPDLEPVAPCPCGRSTHPLISGRSRYRYECARRAVRALRNTVGEQRPETANGNCLAVAAASITWHLSGAHQFPVNALHRQMVLPFEVPDFLSQRGLHIGGRPGGRTSASAGIVPHDAYWSASRAAVNVGSKKLLHCESEDGVVSFCGREY